MLYKSINTIAFFRRNNWQFGNDKLEIIPINEIIFLISDKPINRKDAWNAAWHYWIGLYKNKIVYMPYDPKFMSCGGIFHDLEKI